jgi:transcription elongation factor GreA
MGAPPDGSGRAGTARSRHLTETKEEGTMSVATNGEGRVLVTAEGYEERCRELDRLRTDERRRLSGLLREARRDGATDDKPALIELLDEHALLERRIATVETQLAAAEVAPLPSDGRAAVGSVVRVRDVSARKVFEYQLVGTIEGDPASGRLSIAAPVGAALLGRQRGERVEAATPRGAVTLEVLRVEVPVPAIEAA